MLHEVLDILRDVCGGTIVFLLSLLLKRRLAAHDAERQADKEWRDKVDAFITRGERRRHPRGSTAGKPNGVHSEPEPNGGPGPRVRKPRSTDEDPD